MTMHDLDDQLMVEELHGSVWPGWLSLRMVVHDLRQGTAKTLPVGSNVQKRPRQNRLAKWLIKCLNRPLQEIHSLLTKINDRLNYVGNYRRNIDGIKHIIFSTFFLPFTDRIPTENYRRKCSVGNFRAIYNF